MTTLIGRYAHYHASGIPQYGRIIEHVIDDAVPYVYMITSGGRRQLAVAAALIFDDDAAIRSCREYAKMWQHEADMIAGGEHLEWTE